MKIEIKEDDIKLILTNEMLDNPNYVTLVLIDDTANAVQQDFLVTDLVASLTAFDELRKSYL
jgi:hypothetical protein